MSSVHPLEAGTLPAGQASEPFALGTSGISSPREKSVHGVWGEGLQRYLEMPPLLADYPVKRMRKGLVLGYRRHGKG